MKIKNYSISSNKERKGSNEKYTVIGGDGLVNYNTYILWNIIQLLKNELNPNLLMSGIVTSILRMLTMYVSALHYVFYNLKK